MQCRHSCWLAVHIWSLVSSSCDHSSLSWTLTACIGYPDRLCATHKRRHRFKQLSALAYHNWTVSRTWCCSGLWDGTFTRSGARLVLAAAAWGHACVSVWKRTIWCSLRCLYRSARWGHIHIGFFLLQLLDYHCRIWNRILKSAPLLTAVCVVYPYSSVFHLALLAQAVRSRWLSAR